MANEFRTLDSHSAEYFGDTRNFWWNSDFLELIGKRLSLDRVRDALDVGCGVGHWTHLIAQVLPKSARLLGGSRAVVQELHALARQADLDVPARREILRLGWVRPHDL